MIRQTTYVKNAWAMVKKLIMEVEGDRLSGWGCRGESGRTTVTE